MKKTFSKFDQLSDNHKVGVIILVIIITVLLLGGSIYTIHKHHVQQEQAKIIKKSTQELNEFYQWNYIGVDKVVPDHKLWRNPMSDQLTLNYTVYFNKNKKKDVSVYYDNHLQLELNNIGFYKEETNKPIIKVPESAEYGHNSYYYKLTVNDIDHLKKKGFTSNITGPQIKQELLKLHPNHFKQENK
ncbi:hypothetical protein [Fructilactobacillus carniphilus]|uniref:DUF4367 domain-containing protein n=1 Tax=Fructilactobacillus carniphilus TaxID=2940297 RepID=A0ABY5BVM8_9LACO|nr:hypothetical protein [Fructilactobacillus carniphilus]USS90281.1 hypothetical protein M3M37_05410 [Fructilactobacillus carniphilus]